MKLYDLQKIVKAYDIRGIYPTELDEQLAYKLGRAFTLFIQNNVQKKEVSIVVASDMRISSPSLKQSLVTGLIDQGATVIDIGLASSPTFYFAVGYHNYDGGLIVTASHNPKEYNGFKMVRNQSIPLSKDSGLQRVKEMVEEYEFSSDCKGSLIKKEKILKTQIDHDLTFIQLDSIKQYTIVADPANAMGSLYLEELFSHLPCHLIKMNFDLDGSFPAHQADPLDEKNLEPLKQRVLEEHADFGIATDGDGDRLFFVDEKGEVVPSHILRGVLAKPFLEQNPGASICYDIRPGRITKDIILEFGGKPTITRVGHSLIKEKMREINAVFAGESSGHYFLRFDHGYYEAPVIMIGKILEQLSESNQSFSEFIKPYKKYVHSGEINSKVSNPKEKIKEIISLYHDAISITQLDGVSIEYENYWFNVRASNTEPLLRLNLEAINKDIMEKQRDRLLTIIQSN